MGRDPYTVYHAVMVGAQALQEHRFQGDGPGVPGALEMLEQWAVEDERRYLGPDAEAAAGSAGEEE